MKGPNGCPWCAGSANEDPDTDMLCWAHLAEHEGLSEDELDRMESEQAAEQADMEDYRSEIQRGWLTR